MQVNIDVENIKQRERNEKFRKEYLRRTSNFSKPNNAFEISQM